MNAAIELAAKPDAAAILAMHYALMLPTAPEIAGAWRGEQVWIGGGQVGPHLATFVPPRAALIPEAVEDLVEFLDRDDLPVLAHAALAHAQFETIHPFPDGNGRTGRALVHSLLRTKRLTRAVTVPVSAGLLVDVDAYFAALTAYRKGDAEPIISRFVSAAFSATDNGRQLVSELREIRASWTERITARRSAGAWRLADVLLRQPVVNREVVATELGVAPTNVYGPPNALVAAGVLTETTTKRRGQVWRADEVLAALDAFAARSGRRSRARHAKP
jgi:Fic family protein